MAKNLPAKSGSAIQSASAAPVTARDLDEKLNPLSTKIDSLTESVTVLCTQSKNDHDNLKSTVDRIEKDLIDHRQEVDSKFSVANKEREDVNLRVHDLERGVKFGKWAVRTIWGAVSAAAVFVFTYWDKISSILHTGKSN